jgi:RsiW-degrading membrane proteinase PrsW (M82 family)
MNFQNLLISCYALLQFYVLSLRKTLSLQAMAFLFLLGALGCLPVAIVLENLLSHFFQDSTLLPYISPFVEESIKILPVIYLLFWTRAGASMGLLDGMLCAAAIGCGFGFAEDAIYTIEHAALSADMGAYDTVGSALSTLLPGGWMGAPATWFAGHMAVSALAGLGVGAARRLFASRVPQVAIATLFVAWVFILHAGFDNPPADPSIFGFLFYTLNRGGQHTRFILLVLMLGMLALEEFYIRRTLKPRLIPNGPALIQPKSLLGDLAQMMEVASQGWRRFLQVRLIARHKAEVINLQWQGQRLRSRPQYAERIALLEQLLLLEANPKLQQSTRISPGPAASANSSLIRWDLAIRLAALLPLAFGLWLVFLSPYKTHSTVQIAVATRKYFWVAILGQILLAVQVIRYIRRPRSTPAQMEHSAFIVDRSYNLLMWASGFTSICVWNRIYDLRQLPYPFRPADAASVWAQRNGCLSNPPPGPEESTVTILHLSGESTDIGKMVGYVDEPPPVTETTTTEPDPDAPAAPDPAAQGDGTGNGTGDTDDGLPPPTPKKPGAPGSGVVIP